MKDNTSKSVREYLEGFRTANAFEIEELRRTPVEVKLQRLWAMMSSYEIFETAEEREAGVAEVRERWRRIREGFRRQSAGTEDLPQGNRTLPSKPQGH